MNDVGSAPETVYLHVGAMKTGTSYVQGNLDNSRDALAKAGVLYPGSVGAAVHDVLDKRGARHIGQSRGAWNDLVATIRGWEGPRVVVSMEFLGLATVEQAGRIVESLQPADVRVVLTARDLARTVPSAWQQTTKNRQTTSWPAFLAALTASGDEHDPVREQFWRHHDIATIAQTWSGVVGPERLTVLTLPQRGASPTALWDRFCAAIGLDSASYPVAESNVWNFSLGFAEAEMMRRLNVELGRGIDQPAYRRLVTEFVSGDVLRGAGERTPPPQLPAEAHAWAVRRSRAVVARLDELGVQVVGDLDELLPGALDLDQIAGHEREPAPDDVAAVAVRAVAALVTRLAEVGDSEPPRGARVSTELERRAERRAARRAARAAGAVPIRVDVAGPELRGPSPRQTISPSDRPRTPPHD